MRCYLGRAEAVDRSRGVSNTGLREPPPAHFLGAQNATPGEQFYAILIEHVMRCCAGTVGRSIGGPEHRAQGATSCVPSPGTQRAIPGEQFLANPIDHAMRCCLGSVEIADRSKGGPLRRTQGNTSCVPSLGVQNATLCVNSEQI
jgi:hypothetical protein